MQYGIRLRNEAEMTWEEFCNLLVGLNGDTPLGQIVTIRAEKDPKTIKNYSPEQKRIRLEWQKKQFNEIKQDPQRHSDYIKNFQNMCKQAFGGDVK